MYMCVTVYIYKNVSAYVYVCMYYMLICMSVCKYVCKYMNVCI